MPFDQILRREKKKATTTNYEMALKTIGMMLCFFFCATLPISHFEHGISKTPRHGTMHYIVIVIVIDAILIELFGLYISTGFALCTKQVKSIYTYIEYQHATGHARTHRHGVE